MSTTRCLHRGLASVVASILTFGCVDTHELTGPMGEGPPAPLPMFAVGDPLTWTTINTGTTQSLRAVWGSSADDLFSVGFSPTLGVADATILHSGDGGVTWQAQSSPMKRHLFDVWGADANTVFAVGDGAFNGAVNTVKTTDGGANWVALTSGTAEDLNSVWGSSASNVWAVGSGGGFFHHTGGQTWTEVSPSGQQTTSPLYDAHGSGSSNVWAVGHGSQVYHHDGTSVQDPQGNSRPAWRWQTEPRNLGGSLNHWRGVWTSGPDDVFVVGGGGLIAHYDGTSWSLMNSGTTTNLSSVWGSGPTDVYVSGAGGLLLHYDGSSWSSLNSGVTNGITGLWGASADDVFAVTGAGAQSVVLHGGRASGPENDPPVVEIVAPADGAQFSLGEVVTLEGTANDPEDGPLAGFPSTEWTSDLDGLIGNFATQNAQLSVGTHEITWSATDSEGETSTASITIHVVATPIEEGLYWLSLLQESIDRLEDEDILGSTRARQLRSRASGLENLVSVDPGSGCAVASAVLFALAQDLQDEVGRRPQKHPLHVSGIAAGILGTLIGNAADAFQRCADGQ